MHRVFLAGNTVPVTLILIDLNGYFNGITTPFVSYFFLLFCFSFDTKILALLFSFVNTFF